MALTELTGLSMGIKVERRGKDSVWPWIMSSEGEAGLRVGRGGTASAAVLASRSARSLPGRPLWPLHHKKRLLGSACSEHNLSYMNLKMSVWRRVGGGELDVLADLGGVQMRILLLLGTGMREQVWMCRVKGW